MSISGIGPGGLQVLRWIQLPIALENGLYLSVDFAVVSRLGIPAILGLPFLYQVAGELKVRPAVLATQDGPLPLISTFYPNAIHPQPAPRPPAIPPLLVATSRTPPLEATEAVRTRVLPTIQHLTSTQQRQLADLLVSFSPLWLSGRRGRARSAVHSIKLTTDQPIYSRPRYHPAAHLEAIDTEITKMLADGVIRPSSSPYASEIVMVKKKDGRWRMCIDFRPLNAVTVPDRYPLPRISDLLAAIKDSTWFVLLDLQAGYWQIPMHPDCIIYTAFRCHRGLFEFCVMPFGLTNAPPTFQRLMDHLFGQYRHAGVLVYIDDILVHGCSFETVIARLADVFRILQDEGLTLAMQKCLFFPRRLRYLGQLIEEGKVYPDPDRTAALSRIRPPTDAHEVRQLLGVLATFQRFIPQYSGIVAPITDLLRAPAPSNRKNWPISWAKSHQDALNQAISHLQGQVLTIPLDSDIFQVETDASGTAIGAILSILRDKVWWPVEFMSQKLSSVQRRWPVREREAYAIIAALNKFRPYLHSRPFMVITDHQSLQWLAKASTGKLARWACLLAEFKADIRYRKGSELVQVDFLSRFIDDAPDDIADRMVYTITWDDARLPTVDDILRAQHGVAVPDGKGFYTHSGRIFFHNRIWVPQPLRLAVISAAHEALPFQHCGIRKTVRNITASFNWIGLPEDVRHYVASCLRCQRWKARGADPRIAPRSHPIPPLFHTVYIDIWQCTWRGQPVYVLTMLEQLSKWAEAVQTPNSRSSTIASLLLRRWICRFGVPTKIVSDNAQGFVGEDLVARLGRMGCRSVQITPYHPQGNVVERFHRTLAFGLAQFSPEQHDFEEALDLALYCYRSTMHSATKESPAFLMYGRDLGTPRSSDWRFLRQISSQERIRFLNLLRLEIQLRAVNQSNTAFGPTKPPLKFEADQLVLLRPSPPERAELLHTEASHKKFLPLWSTPYRVIHVGTSGQRAFVRNLLSGRTREVHISDVCPVSPPQNQLQKESWEKALAPDLTMFQPDDRAVILQQFWEEVHHPVGNDTASHPQKRKRAALGGHL